MTKIISTRVLTASAFAAAAAISMMSLGSTAQASSQVVSCNGAYNQMVLECCGVTNTEQFAFMVRTGKHCGTDVKYRRRIIIRPPQVIPERPVASIIALDRTPGETGNSGDKGGGRQRTNRSAN